MSTPRRTLRAPTVPPPGDLAVLRSFVKSRPQPTADTPAVASPVKAVVTQEPPTPIDTMATGMRLHRVTFNTRLAADVDAALKRASLERKLKGQSPHTFQDIVDEALRPWLAKNGYLK